MQQNFVYPAKLTPEKVGGFSVQFVDLPEAITQGEDRKDALIQAADCLEEAIAGRIDDQMEIPEPSAARRGQVLVTCPAPMAAKAALYLAIKASGETNVALARRRTEPRQITKERFRVGQLFRATM